MPELQDTRKRIKTTIPSIPESEIVLRDGVLGKDLEHITEGEFDKMSDFKRGVVLLEKMIESWNLTEEGVALEPVAENILKLNISDIEHLFSETTMGAKQREQLQRNEQRNK